MRDSMFRAYADLAVHVGLNLRAGQRLLIIGPLANGGASLEAAPLVRQITESAYRAGARAVEALWGDEAMQLSRLRLAPRDVFEEYSRWLPDALVQHVDAGDAVLSVYANDPDQLKDEDPQLVSTVQQATSRAVRPFRERISRNATNWSIVAASVPSWARKVFPDLDDDRAVEELWTAIGRLCRLDQPDPVAAWREHLESLAKRRDLLNDRHYAELTYRGPGTDLTIGLPDDHVWVSGQSTAANGITFAPNVPTEEVFTMAHKDRVNGIVSSTKPLSYAGTLIENFRLEFVEGRAVQVWAEKGLEMLRELVAADEGAARLGEIALVPHSSPISQSGLLFYNTLFDENAASHVALGSAYKFTMAGGEEMSDEAFEAAGGNRSVVHVDFMIGSSALDIDGVRRDGTVEPLMRGGEWV
ncbi:MAG TPA: aminopeptidase [Vicinamibacterales bacterium]